MDEYSRATIKILLEHNKKYLSEILLNILPEGTDVNSITRNATVDTICAVIASQTTDIQDKNIDSIYTCRCGSKMVVLREVQLRSADEGSTVVHVCEMCGHKW